MSAIIEVSGLRKEYRNRRGKRAVAIDDLDLTIDMPGVYGFLGPNGSGKTTTIRCLLGLITPTAGSVKLFGADVTDRRQLGEVIQRVGALVEGPKFSPDLTGRTNLWLLARLGDVTDDRIDEVLDIVELTDAADGKVGTYSLGMNQRLGVAAALLRNPDLIILDEPGNGLDPAGIADMRRLVRRLADEGRTVFVSSHQLAEVQQMCDEVIIIANGRNVASGTVDDILHSTADRRFVVTITDRVRACSALERVGISALPSLEPNQIVVQLEAGDESCVITRVLANNGMYLSGLRADTVNLEQAFLALTAAAATPFSRTVVPMVMEQLATVEATPAPDLPAADQSGVVS